MTLSQRLYQQADGGPPAATEQWHGPPHRQHQDVHPPRQYQERQSRPDQVGVQRTTSVYAHDPQRTPSANVGDAQCVSQRAAAAAVGIAVPIADGSAAAATQYSGDPRDSHGASIRHPTVEQQTPTMRWHRDPRVSALVTPMFRSFLVSRLVTASVAHATHALQHLGDRASEPGPHALLLLSAQPEPPAWQPARPPWWTPSIPVTDETPTARERVASRLVGMGDGDDIFRMLADLTTVAATQISTAAAERKLLHQLDTATRAQLAKALNPPLRPLTPPPAPGEPSLSPDAFPYAQALTEGLLWDPRMPHTGIAPTSREPLTTDTLYLGVAVTTLDTPTERWVDVKHRWKTACDPESGMPITAAAVPGTAWALLEDGTALQVDRLPHTPRQARTYQVLSNAPVIRGFDQVTTPANRPHLVQGSPALPHGPHPSAQLSAELWDRLAALHTVLRSAFGYRRTS